MNSDLQDMLRISHGVGRDPRMVQGGGGNTSVKTDGGAKMYVKASGTALGDMEQGSGYRLVDVPECIAILDDEELRQMDPTEREQEVVQRLKDSTLDELTGRPSVETSLHAMLGRVVVHTHPSTINGLLCAEGGRQALDQLFGQMDPLFLYVEFCGAGYVLAMRLRQMLDDYRQEHHRLPEAIFLENHGLFVTCQDAERALQITSDIFDRVERAAQQAGGETTLRVLSHLDAERKRHIVQDTMAAARRFYADIFGHTPLLRLDQSAVVEEFFQLPQAPDLAEVRPMTPDQAAYCKDAPMWLVPDPKADDWQERVTRKLQEHENGDDTPLCILLDGVGLICAAPAPKLLNAVTETMKASLEILNIAAHFGGPRPLEDQWIRWMREWEVERFRVALVSDLTQTDLAGKVAVVTGAGSGLGRGIATCLAGKGVNVVLADVDLPAAQETADLIAREGGWAWAHRVDVTSEQDTADMFYDTVCDLGGVDILINCAGIAPAHPLTDFPLEDWDRTLEINLTGYFLQARQAARCMIRQDMGGAILNLSSKTGLEASKHNSAYNATKAGEIHLARGWALDLAEHGIRVNSVCPGNVFDGSQIWNEDYIQSVAEKRGIEPDEVIPYYIGLTALKEEITSDDVGEAVAFLVSDRAAKVTGQILVVDGGQVFVR